MTALTASVSSSSTPTFRQLVETPVLFEVETDFSLDGMPQTLDLQISLDGVRLLSNQTGSLFTTLDWCKIASFRTVAGVGSGLLQVKIDDVWTECFKGFAL